MFIDLLGISDNAFNILVLYEPGFRPLYWQFGLGLVVGKYHHEDEDTIYAGGIGIRVGLGYNYALGKYIIIRPAVELNLGFKKHQSNYSFNLNFGFKTPNLW